MKPKQVTVKLWRCQGLIGGVKRCKRTYRMKADAEACCKCHTKGCKRAIYGGGCYCNIHFRANQVRLEADRLKSQQEALARATFELAKAEAEGV